MKRIIVLAAATAAVWLALHGLPWPARALTVFLAVPLSAIAVAQLRVLASVGVENLPRIPIYISSGISLWLLAFLALLAAGSSRFPAALIGLRPIGTAAFLAWTAFGVAAALMLYAFGKYYGLRESPLLAHLLPRTALERVAFIALSITAGICEELVFRGFLIAALAVPLQSTILAALLSSVIFGVLHAYQHVTGALRSAILGLALAIPFIATGSILPSMVAHVTIDVIGGIWLVRERE